MLHSGPMNLYELTVPQLQKMLTNLARWIDKAHDHAKARGFDPNVLLSARLAPDQFPLLRQVQSVCDNAKFLPARLSGKTPPSHPDTEQTWDELRARIQAVVDYLGTFSAADFEGAETRLVPMPYMPGKGMEGRDYLVEYALPNFHFHLVTAYQLLRHNGVELGKLDYIGSANLKDI